MLAVPYFEKALYELPDDQLNASTVSDLADQIELQIQGGLSSRPLLSVPHLLSDEASCYYHGYVLAEMAVHQTRAFFLNRDGYIVDNPSVGPTLNQSYWAVGNSQPFLTLVENLTESPLTGDAWVSELNRPVDTVISEEKQAYDKMAADESKGDSQKDGQSNGDVKEEVKLDMHIKIVDGDAVIADTDADGGFLQSCQKFEKYIRDRFSCNKRAKTGTN